MPDRRTSLASSSGAPTGIDSAARNIAERDASALPADVLTHSATSSGDATRSVRSMSFAIASAEV